MVVPLADATVHQCVVWVHDPAAVDRRLDGHPWLRWLLREFIRFGVTEFLLLSDRLPRNLQESLPCPVRISQAAVAVGTGSGGALFAVRDRLADRFLWCDASVLFDWNVAQLLADALADGPEVLGRIARFGGDGRCDVAIFRRALLGRLRPACSLVADVLPELLATDLVRVTPTEGGFVAQHAREQARGTDLRPGVRLRRKALMLDRDGVLNIDRGYVSSRDRFEWIDCALQAVRLATQAGWHVFVVTNQSGVARGLYPEQAVHSLLRWMAGQVRAAGGTIDDARFCPYHPDAVLDAYRKHHPWRKPLPGMLLDLIRVWELDPQRVVLVGDQETDMRAAAAAGVAGHLFRGGNLLAFLRPILALDPD